MNDEREKQPVVVGVDGSPNSLVALSVALRLAVRHRAELRVVYATPPRHPQSSPPHPSWAAQRMVDDAVACNPLLRVSYRLAPTPPVALLVEESESALMLLVGEPEGAHDDPGTATADNVVCRVSCPVRVVGKAA